VLHEGNPF